MRRIILFLFRIFSYLFAMGASLAFLALGIVARSGGQDNLVMDQFPWKGTELTNWLIGLGIFGLIATYGAVSGNVLRYLLPLWIAAVAYFIIKGNFLGPHTFENDADFKQMAAVAVGSVVAFLASLQQLGKRKQATGKR